MTRQKLCIVTSTYDLTTDYLVERYSRLIDFYRYNLDKYENYEIDISANQSIIRSSNGREISFDESVSILFRKPSMPKYEMPREVLDFTYKEIFSQIEGILESHDGRVIERPCTLRRANNKILQLKLANKIGFKTPESHISNSKSVILRKANERTQIIKPISIGRIVGTHTTTNIQTEILSDTDELNDLRFCPSYFQDYIQKDFEVRLTVVGTIFYGVKIQSNNTTDWRKDKNNKLSVVDIPASIKEKCIEFMQALGVNFGAFDFIVSNGEYFFLEINPNGQWLWLEQKLGLDISKSLMEMLTK